MVLPRGQPARAQHGLVRRLARPALGAACAALAGQAAWAADCASLGLAQNTGMVLQIREAAQGEVTAMVYRDAARRDWFVPLQGDRIAATRATRLACDFKDARFWRIPQADPALTHDNDNDLLTFLDIEQATDVIDGRKARKLPQGEALDSLGTNYQLMLNYADADPASKLKPSVYGEIYGRVGGWYVNTTLGWSNYGRIARYESYALKEWLDSGTFLRLGDAVTGPTALGESQQFAGISWGNARELRPGDFSPVLPTLRNGNTLASPLEVYLNDNLLFQQTLQNGVYDLRNLPAQQGFNSYTVRTTDAQGNPVTVQREIYLPAALLPPGISSYRIDAGFQRQDFFTANANYGPPFVSASYATGVNNDVTLNAQGFVSQAASIFSAGYEQRLGALWTGHLGLIGAKNGQRRGEALQTRIDGGGRWWRLLLDWTRAGRALPGLSDRAGLLSQRLLQAQWSGITDWTLGLTMVNSQREQGAPEDVATLSATTRVNESGASLSMALTQVNAGNKKQNNLMVSLFMPLSLGSSGRNQSLFASQSNVDGVQLTRAQYSDGGQSPEAGNWSLGATRDSRRMLSSLDGYWSGSTENTDLMASARVSQASSDAQLSLRSGLLWAGGGLFVTRPILGSFAMVSTGTPKVSVFYENRPAGRTNERGLLLVPELRPLESNRLTVDPASWPIHWTATEIERNVIPPRGGGVLVSFRINSSLWPAESILLPLDAAGKAWPGGSLVGANVDGEARESVIDRQGKLWIAELLPAKTFTVSQGGRRCEYTMPAADGASETTVKPTRCQDKP